jgi:outer membrane protein OmpA-like peptidoglycan-associated protein
MKRYARILIPLSLIFLFWGCAQTQELSKTKTAQGAAIGTAAGTIAGAVIGHQSGHRGAGALIGAATGAVVGGAIGNKLDQQAKELEKIPDTHVNREQDRLVVSMSDSVLFDVNSAAIKAASRGTLDKMADVMVRYPDSDILVKGHTDSTGTEAFNQALSERRAKMVRNYLIDRGVSALRITAIGFGETMPIAPNDTPQDRQKNRRVEIEIKPTAASG